MDPILHAVEKVRANTAQAPELGRPELKARIAEQVRADSSQRGAPTQEHTIQELAPELPREELSTLLTEMAGDDAYRDVKAIIAPSGRIYLFSEGQLTREKAAEKCLVEEAKFSIVKRIRKDSQFVVLTPVAELEMYFPWPEPERRAALLDEIMADEQFEDIQKVTGPRGEVYFHSDAYVSGNYGKIMMRARTSDAAFAIAELVRDRSRIMPAPTKLTVFDDRVFGLSRAQIDAFVDGLSKPDPVYADIRKLVHPTTGAVYLYSEKWIHEETAFRIMDWEEVGAAQNP